MLGNSCPLCMSHFRNMFLMVRSHIDIVLVKAKTHWNYNFMVEPLVWKPCPMITANKQVLWWFIPHFNALPEPYFTIVVWYYTCTWRYVVLYFCVFSYCTVHKKLYIYIHIYTYCTVHYLHIICVYIYIHVVLYFLCFHIVPYWHIYIYIYIYIHTHI